LRVEVVDALPGDVIRLELRIPSAGRVTGTIVRRQIDVRLNVAVSIIAAADDPEQERIRRIAERGVGAASPRAVSAGRRRYW
jgi:hypothetical protein